MLMNDKGFGGRSLRVLASLRLSVVVMVTIGAICAYATFYEMRHGTPAVQRDFYQTSWFAFLLGLLGLNVLAAMVSRWPWSKHHVGFLAAHVGILLVLVGSVVSLYRGLDSNMALYEGETSDRVSLLEPSLQVHVPGLGVSGTFAVRFEKQPPRPGRELRFAVPGSDVVLVARDYAPHVEVTEAVTPAGPRRTLTPRPPPAKEARRQAAVLLQVEGAAAKSEPTWVLWGERTGVAFGGEQASVAFRSPEARLPFQVTLVRFNNESYPGSRMAATYESTVRIDDPERGSFETLVSMNHPLHHRGYIFFQSSFVEGRPMISIFSVARAPGLPLVYLGTTLVGAGILWMFYVKPWLARRQGALALAAHSTRENRHEAQSADPQSLRA
jgi:hypothetical protein